MHGTSGQIEQPCRSGQIASGQGRAYQGTHYDQKTGLSPPQATARRREALRYPAPGRRWLGAAPTQPRQGVRRSPKGVYSIAPWTLETSAKPTTDKMNSLAENLRRTAEAVNGADAAIGHREAAVEPQRLSKAEAMVPLSLM